MVGQLESGIVGWGALGKRTARICGYSPGKKS